MNRGRRALQGAIDIGVTVLVHLGLVRFRDDQPRPRYDARVGFPTAPSSTSTVGAIVTSPQDDPYDFDTVGRILRGVGSSQFKEMWPTRAREEWLRHQPEDVQQSFRARHADWLPKVDRYHRELDERRAAAERPTAGDRS